MSSTHRAGPGLVMMMGLAMAAFAGDPPRTIGPYGAEVQLAFAPDGKRLAVTVRGGSGALVDLARNGERVRRFDGDADESESAVAISPDGTMFALACAEGYVRVFDLESGDEQASFSHGGPVRSLAFTSDGKGLVTGGGLPWKEPAEGMEEEARPTEEPDPDGPTARVWDPATGGKLHDLDAKTGNTSSRVAASPAAPIVAVARGDGKLVLFDLAQKKRHEVEVPGCGGHVAFSGDGKLVAVVGGEAMADCTLIDVGAGKVLKAVGRRQTDGVLGALAVSPDGKTVACTGPGTGVRLLDVAGGPARALEGGAVASLAFSPDGKTLAVGLRTGQVQLHDLSAGGGLGDEKK